MAVTYQVLEVIKQLKPWIGSLRFNVATNQWEGTFKPQRTVIKYELASWVVELERHVITELIEVCADVLGIFPDNVSHRTRNREVTDLRAVVSILIYSHFDKIRQSSINDILGWRNRCSFVNAAKQAQVREVQEKLAKVYRAYPSLRKGLIEIECKAESQEL